MAVGPFSVVDADAERIVPLGEALRFLPEVPLDPDQARRAGHGGAVAAPAGVGGAEVVRLTDPDGLIAIAAPRRSDRTLRPVVVLRG
jgi:tRNA pseudouridine55 synthase